MPMLFLFRLSTCLSNIKFNEHENNGNLLDGSCCVHVWLWTVVVSLIQINKTLAVHNTVYFITLKIYL